MPNATGYTPSAPGKEEWDSHLFPKGENLWRESQALCQWHNGWHIAAALEAWYC